jgi:hypothetical protein
MGHGYGETEEAHAHHAHVPHVPHWGLPPYTEAALFYIFASLSWAFLICASVLGSYYDSGNKKFIATATPCMFFSWAAWWQTVVGMMQRASWVRDESNLADRRKYLYFAVRLQRLMLVSRLSAPKKVLHHCSLLLANGRYLFSYIYRRLRKAEGY